MYNMTQFLYICLKLVLRYLWDNLEFNDITWKNLTSKRRQMRDLEFKNFLRICILGKDENCL